MHGNIPENVELRISRTIRLSLTLLKSSSFFGASLRSGPEMTTCRQKKGRRREMPFPTPS